MGIFEYLRKKHNKNNEVEFATETTTKPEEKKEDFVAALSYVELQYADWKRFAGMLKRDGVFLRLRRRAMR